MSLSKVMTRGVILHCTPKKEPLKAQPKMGEALHEDTYPAGPFGDTPIYSIV